MLGDVVRQRPGDRRSRLGEVVADLGDGEALAIVAGPELVVVQALAQDAVELADLRCRWRSIPNEPKRRCVDEISQSVKSGQRLLDGPEPAGLANEAARREPGTEGGGISDVVRLPVMEMKRVRELGEQLLVACGLRGGVVISRHVVTSISPLTSYSARRTLTP